MVAIPLAHISWAIADNADRKACDQFFIDVFGAQIAYEMLITPEAEAMADGVGHIFRVDPAGPRTSCQHVGRPSVALFGRRSYSSRDSRSIGVSAAST